MKKTIALILILALSFLMLSSCGEEEPENVEYDSLTIAKDELKGIKRFWHKNVIKVKMDKYCFFFADDLPANTLLDYRRNPPFSDTFYLLQSNSNEFSCFKVYVGLNEEISKGDVELSNEVYSFYYKYALSPELVFGSDVDVKAIYCFSGIDPHGGGSLGRGIPSELDIYFVTSEGDFVLSRFCSVEYLFPINVYKRFAIEKSNDKQIYMGGIRQILYYADDLTPYVFETP